VSQPETANGISIDPVTKRNLRLTASRYAAADELASYEPIGKEFSSRTYIATTSTRRETNRHPVYHDI
jgi:hypothetical protein